MQKVARVPKRNTDICAGLQTSRKLVLGQFDAREFLKDTRIA
jgi:hypothetical protein